MIFFKINRDGIMTKLYTGSVILAGALLLSGCSSFIKTEDSEKLSLKYQAGEYVLLEDIKRNETLIPKDTPVKLLVLTSDDWIKIYVYNSSEELLNSHRFLALYMFEDDFPDKKYSQDYFDTRLLKIVKTRDSADQPVKETKKETKKNKKVKK